MYGIDARTEIEFENHRDMVLGGTGDPFENDPAYINPYEGHEKAAQAVRIVAEHQLMSEDEGRAWMTGLLSEARDAGAIKDFEVTGSYPGVWGLQLVTFTFDLPLGDDERVKPDMDHDEAKEASEGLLSEILRDSAQVRWVSSID